MSIEPRSGAKSRGADPTGGIAGPRGVPISRRAALRRGLGGAAGLVLAGGPRLEAEVTPPAPPAKAKAVIQVFLWGGPPHLDTFDPKPEAGRDYCGPLNKPIETNVPGIRICELLPGLAKQADKYALIRSMTHRNNGHETAPYMMQTGHGGPYLVPTGHEAENRTVYPNIGAVVSLFKGYNAGYKGLIPPYVVLTHSQGRFSESGFLGSRYKPFATGGDPNQQRFEVEGITARGITDQRQKARRDFLHTLNALGNAMPDNPELKAAAEAEKSAYELILGEGAKVFDLSLESKELRDRYGRCTFGQECVAARRLVESGVPYVCINYPGGWDTHSRNFESMRRMLPQFDAGLATLLWDLDQRGLLQSTIVWCCGEFGRTPKIDWQPPWDGGRGHWGNCFSVLVAGGGFKGGQVVGASDAKGEEVKDRPVYPVDLLGSMYELLGIDTNARLPHPLGLEAHVLPTAAEGVKTGGRLKEITS